MNSQEWLTRLIAIDTTSRNTNLPLIDLIGNWFERHSIPIRLTPDSEGKKANLFATLPAKDGSLKGGLVFSGHTDVVPVDGQFWTSDPFKARLSDGRIYGRGACDMKGFIAVVLALLPEFQKMGLSRPLHFAFSYDEEVGCMGAPAMIADFRKQGIEPAGCIVGEPTEMHPVVAHKGINNFQCRLHGHAAHSSLTPSGCNAIEHAADLICWLRSLADELKKGPKDKNFDVPFTSLTCNLISGGIACNIIPALSEFIFEFRNLPEVNPEGIISRIKAHIEGHIVPAMRKEYREAAVEIESLGGVPAFEASEGAKITQAARAASGETALHKVSYATEAGLFQEAGIPTIVCGPGSIVHAHRADEFVTLEQLHKCETFLRQLALKF